MKNLLSKLASASAALLLSAGIALALFQSNIDGIGLGSTTAPVLTSCGTSPTITGNDMAGTVTTGTGTPAGCVVTFNSAKSSAPHCVLVWSTGPLAAMSYTTSTTAITVTQTATNSTVIKYFCAGT